MLPSPIKPIFMWLPRCCCQAVGRAVHAVRGGAVRRSGAATTMFLVLPPLCGSPARGRKGCSRGRALHAVGSGGAAPTDLCGSLACGRKGCSLGVLCTPFAARALLLHTAVGALPVGEGLFPGRALHAVRSGGAAPTPLCGSPARGGKGGSLGVLCTPFAARALLLHTAVGAPPSGRMARSARPLSCA